MREFSFKDFDEMIRGRIVFGTISCKIREKLLNEGKDLTLGKAIDIARTYGMSQSQVKSMEATDEVVHSVKGDQRSRKEPPKVQQRGTCGRYGRTPAQDSFPAMGKTCLKGKKAKHFDNMNKRPAIDNPYQVSDSFFVESTSEDVNEINQVFVNIEIGSKETLISFKLDTGAQVDVILLHAFVSKT